MQRTIRVFLVAAALWGAASHALAARGGGQGAPCDDVAIAAARALLDQACDCAAATSHGSYVSCAVRALNVAAKDGTVPKSCKRLLKRGIARSVCGKAGAVTCCRTGSSGRTACSIKRTAEACRAPLGGTACVSLKTSCLDACTPTGCASPAGALVDGAVLF